MVQAVDPRSLTNKEKKRACPAVYIIKQKRIRIIKRKICAIGSQQGKYIKEYESIASPTVALYSVFTTLLVDTYEKQEVATFDIPCVYLHVKLSKDRNKEKIL